MKNYTQNSKLNAKLLIVGSVVALLVAFAPFVGFANDDSHDGEDRDNRSEANFEQKLEVKLNNEHSNSIWKRLAAFFNRADIDTKAEFQAEFKRAKAQAKAEAKSERKNAKIEVRADVSAPVISNVRISSTTSGGATISWKTNEPSNSKVFFTKIFPVDIAASTTANVSADAMVKNHSVNLTNLSADTLYYFKTQSADGSQNVQLSGTGAFMTTAQ